jgi:hypothetical protein
MVPAANACSSEASVARRYAERQAPLGQSILLRLHRTEPADDLLGAGETAGGEPLTTQA